MGLIARSFDVANGEPFDLTQPAAFLLGLVVLRRLQRGALCLLAPPCSSFCWANMGTSLRSWLHPAGDGGVAGVRQGNFLAARSWLYTIFARALGAATILEQPAHRAGTAMEGQPFFQKCIREFHTVRLEVCQDCWGAETRKPTWLYVSHAVPWAWMCEQKPEKVDMQNRKKRQLM
ncbi:unnamed protein product, partial [Effrenium voratum]